MLKPRAFSRFGSSSVRASDFIGFVACYPYFVRWRETRTSGVSLHLPAFFACP